MQGSVASFHFRNELSLSEGGRPTRGGRRGARQRSWLGQAGKWAGRQADLARSGSAVARGGGGDLGGVRVRLYLIYAPQCL